MIDDGSLSAGLLGVAVAQESTQTLLASLERVNRTLRALSAGNHTLLHASEERALLYDMCKVIVEVGGYRIAGVGYANDDQQKTIRWVAAIGVDIELLRTLHFTWADTEQGRTVSGTAVRTGKPCVAKNLLLDPAYSTPVLSGLREHALEHGYVASTALPLRVDGEVIGALAMSSADPESFDAQEVELLSELAANLGYGIANLRVRIQHRKAQAAIAELAFYDPMTSLPNRALLLEHLEGAIGEAKRNQETLALLHLDITHFREINKVLGYHAGNVFLQALAYLLKAKAKVPEVLARVGESEFALMLPHSDADYAIKVAQRLVVALQEPVEVANLMLDPQAVIGIALYPRHGADPDVLLRRANTAMHEASTGSGSYALYTGGQEEEYTRRLSLMADLRHAISHNELQLYCQPKLDISSRRLCGAEALVRWLHPAQGMILPLEFIKLAEQAGIITPLTHWMLDAVFEQSGTWREAGLEQPLSVNLSAHDLFAPGLVDRIHGLFSSSGIPANLIQFELTESALLADPSGAMKTLTNLKMLGVELFIDDFGTGYSSLEYLQKLPVDAIKIDQSFVMPMVRNRDSAIIVRSTVELGHNLQMAVVAEGVESQAVWDSLAEMGCDQAQGYFISKPMPSKNFEEWQKGIGPNPPHS